MDRKRLETAWIVIKEHFGSSRISCAPSHKVHCDADGLLGRPSNISGEQTHTETLRGPESEDDPVTNEEASACCIVLVHDGHDHNRTDKCSVERLVRLQ